MLVVFAFILYGLVYRALFFVFGVPIAVYAALKFRGRHAELIEIQRELAALNPFRKEAE